MENFVGNKIMKIRELKGYSQEYLSSKLGISQTALSKIESMITKKIDDSKFKDIAMALGVKEDDILNFNESMIFYNCSQSGQIKTINNNPSLEKVQELYERIINQQKEEINNLKNKLGVDND